MAQPDWKPARRVVDRDALRRARTANPWCAICFRHGVTFHHVLPRGERGDDDARNGVMLCGDGTTGCHGLVEARDRDARHAVYVHITTERPETIEYLDEKLGGLAAALYYLERNYHRDRLTPPARLLES